MITDAHRILKSILHISLICGWTSRINNTYQRQHDFSENSRAAVVWMEEGVSQSLIDVLGISLRLSAPALSINPG